jgi:hypothetical protein
MAVGYPLGVGDTKVLRAAISQCRFRTFTPPLTKTLCRQLDIEDIILSQNGLVLKRPTLIFNNLPLQRMPPHPPNTCGLQLSTTLHPSLIPLLAILNPR